VNWRAIGCLTVGALAFIGIGLLGMSLAFSRLEGCPRQVQWGDRAYLPAGTSAPSPDFDEPGEPVHIGSTFIGLTTRRVFGPPGSAPSTEAEDRPDRIAIDCDDGTFQTYIRGTDLTAPSVSVSP
jgi:hypothetical protein